jgi:hypothetical protein
VHLSAAAARGAAGRPSCTGPPFTFHHRDIDRFGRAVLEGWLGRGGGSGGSTGSASSGSGSDSGSGSGSGGKSRDGGGSGSGGGGVCPMGAAVADSRRACRLPNLIGAAPVVYGVPCLINPAGLQKRMRSM